MKTEKFSNLLKELKKCDSCTNLCEEKSLINIYNDYIFCTNIPSIWTDWFNRLNSKIMIIGQDWGSILRYEKISMYWWRRYSKI